MIRCIWLGCLAVGAVIWVASPALGVIQYDKKCEMPIGCTGQYNCCPDTSYSCTTPGMSRTKRGEAWAITLCSNHQGATCDEIDILCQIDFYYKADGCQVHCNTYPRYVHGCIPQGE